MISENFGLSSYYLKAEIFSITVRILKFLMITVFGSCVDSVTTGPCCRQQFGIR